MKQFTQHDIDTAERITAVETKLDNIDKNLSARFDGIEDTLKEIKTKQNQQFSFNDAFKFVKSNWRMLTVLFILFAGGDALRVKAFDFILGNGHSSAQSENKNSED